MYRYLAVFDPAEDVTGAVNVTFPDVPGATTFGNGMAHGREMARDALEIILEDYIENKKDLPEAKTRRSKSGQWIEPSPLAQMKLALYQEFRKQRISKTELAKRMGIAKQQIDRLFELQRSTTVAQLESAFRALGKTLVVSVGDAV